MVTAPWGNTTAEQPGSAWPSAPLQSRAEASNYTGRPPPGQITVTLIPRVGEELQQLHEHTGLSWTDIVNRAISFYQFIEEQVAAGKHLLIRDENTGETQTVIFK